MPLAVAALLAVPPAAIGSGVAGARVIYSTETPYQYVRVLQFASGERWLQLNEGVAVHSDYRPWSWLTGGYWDQFLAVVHDPRRIAILGNAAGTTAREFGHFYPRTRVDAVELDGTLTTIGRRYFDLRGPNLHLYTADARPWLAASHARYDAIFLDAYRQPYIPFYLLTKEFFENVRAHLNPTGVFAINVGHIPGLGRAREGHLGDAARRVPLRDARRRQRHEHDPGGERGTAARRCDVGFRRDRRSRADAQRRRCLHRRPRPGRVAHRPLDPPLRDGVR